MFPENLKVGDFITIPNNPHFFGGVFLVTYFEPKEKDNIKYNVVHFHNGKKFHGINQLTLKYFGTKYSSPEEIASFIALKLIG